MGVLSQSPLVTLFCLAAAVLLGYRFFGMDSYGNLHSASASLCAANLCVIFHALEQYTATDPTQYAAGVRAFAWMLEFLCESSSSYDGRGTLWVWCST